jgi:hypothetical protein
MAENKANADELAHQAYLYAGGELSDAERDSFEQRLAIDQAAREALADAVGMIAALRGETPRADPSYRDRVRRKLRPSWWSRLLARRSYRGHPLLWTVAGAAASLLVALTLLRPAPEVRVIEREVPVLEQDDDPALHDISAIWAELSTPDHAIRAAEEENRRKNRQEDRRVIRRGMQQSPASQ